MKIENPYRSESLRWRRGNLHAHTTLSDGVRAPQDLVDQYAARGYDFLMISDHDMITNPGTVDSRGMTLIPGNEVTVNGPHILHVGATAFVAPNPDRQQVLDAIAADNAFAVVAHPNWERNFNHCPQECLERWNGYTGVEIYNGLVRAHAGDPLATSRWDQLLGQGRRVWGFANDDAHFAGDEGVAWNVVQSASADASAILGALRAGQFYASTGVTILRVRVAGNAIHVATENAERIVVNGDFGRRLAQVDGAEMTFTVPGDTECSYVRFECFGRGESMAWTQPFFLTR